MTGSPKVIAALRAAAPLEAHLNLQYRLDTRLLKFMGVRKVAKKTADLGDDAHCFLKKITDRLLFLGGDADYGIDPVTQAATVTDLIERDLKLEMAIVSPYEQAVQTAMQAFDDTTRNLFEHLLKWHEQHVAWLEQQKNLIAGLGEADYIAEQL